MDSALANQLDRYIHKLQELKKTSDSKLRIMSLRAKANHSALALKSASGFLIHCALAKTLRRNLAAISQSGCVALLSVPTNWELDKIVLVLKELFKNDKELKLCCHPTSKHKRGWEIEPDDFLSSRRLIIVAVEGCQIHEDFELAITVRDRLDLADLRHLKALSRLRGCGDFTEQQAQMISRQPLERMAAIFRIGQPVWRAADRLSKESVTRGLAGEIKKLDIFVGFGEASTWASELLKDLNDWRAGSLPWSEVDTGCLLFGPTGTGKTRFAATLASVADLHLEASSISRWQSNKDGALGDMLSAMYRSFAAAKANAPSMLFIDEFDSIGDRSKFPSRHADYSTQVVNALLECLDGVEGRDGVIVVAACNFPERIDPALLRGGRLEKHISFPLPDADSRAAILAHYLPSLAADLNLKEIAARLPEKSGADLERLAREAKKIARRENRLIIIDDVLARIDPLPTLTEADQYRIAVHEAGHAIVAHTLKVGKVVRVEIFDNMERFATEIEAHGITVVEYPSSPFKTMREKRNLIAMHLAGAAAEQFLFDDRSSMSTGSKTSDFAKATMEAIEMVSKCGLGKVPYFLPNSVDIHSHSELWRDERLEVEVNEILEGEFQRVKEILAGLQNPLIKFAARLLRHKRLEGKELEGLWPGAIYRMGIAAKEL